jgi:lactoylglutathione lyase
VLGDVPATVFGRLTMLKLPGEEFVSIELVTDPTASPTGRSGLHHLVVGVDDVHTCVARLADRGIKAEPPASPDDSDDFWTAWLTDPDGHRIELVQWPPGHPEGMTEADLTPSGSPP